jgi:hypothetical protein
MPTSAGSTTVPLLDAPPRVIDLRGTRGPIPSPAILVDPSGRRARHLRVAGRVLGSVFLLWLCGLLLAGLGLVPASDIPFAGTIRAAQEPAQLSQLPSPRPGSRADLRPARPLRSLSDAAGSVASGARDGAALNRGAAGRTSAGSTAAALSRRSDAARNGGSRSTGSGAPTSSPGSSQSSAPPASGATPSSSTTGTTHGNGRGSSSTTPSAGAGSGNGQSTTPHGSSATAPGHDPTRTPGHGKQSG